jgi:hypothetical protein
MPKLITSILFLAWVSFATGAQDEEKVPDEATKAETKTKVVTLPMPTSLLQQHKDDLTHYLPPNEVKPLLAGPDDYITLITENTSINNKGIAILLPDWQQGATNPKAINFLRNSLPKQGWTTISIQPASKPEGFPSNAVKLSEQQQENKTIIDKYKMKLAAMMNAVITKANDYPGIVIIIAQGNHGALLVELLDSDNDQMPLSQPPNALVLLSSYLHTNNALIDETNTTFATALAFSEYPVLDLLLRHDHPIVLDKAQQRLSLAKKEMKVYYRQRQLNNPAMGYYPEQELLIQINSWLKSIGW